MLYTVPIDGSGPALLFGPGQGLHLDYAIAADSQHVVFTASLDGFGIELFSAPVDRSGPPLRLHAPFSANVSGFVLAGSRVAFRLQDQQLHGARIDVAESATLLAAPGALNAFAPSADGEHVTYQGEEGTEFQDRLRAARLDGTQSPFLLHGALSPSMAVTEFRVSPGEARVFWLADAQDGVLELFTTPIAEGAPDTRLNGSFQPEIAGDVVELRASTDGRHALYLADQETNEAFHLYSVPGDGSAPPRRLSPDLISDVLAFELDPAGDLVVMTTRAIPAREALHAVNLGSSARARNLTPGLPNFASISSTRIVPGGAFVLYVADQERDEFRGLFVVPTDGSTGPRKLSGAIEGGLPPSFAWRGVRGFALCPDQGRVVYVADQETSAVQLYGVALDGSAAAVELTSDSASALCLYEQSVASATELYLVRLDGSVPPVRIHPPLPSLADVSLGARIAPDGRHALYLADAEVDGYFDLYSVPLLGGLPKKVDGPLAFEGDVLDFQLGRTGLVFYRADRTRTA